MDFDKQAIVKNLKHLTHGRDEFKGLMLEPATLEWQCPLDNDEVKIAEKTSTASLGVLRKLPIEIISKVFIDLDIQTLTNLRSVNDQARQIVSSLPEYKEIFTHAPSSIRAILSLKTAKSISLKQLHEVLCSQECVSCGRFGSFLYLITAGRACYICLTTKDEFLPLTKINAKIAFGLSNPIVAQLPAATSVPGQYGLNLKKEPRPKTLVDRSAAMEAGIEVHGSIQQMESYVKNEKDLGMAKWSANYDAAGRRLGNLPPFVDGTADYHGKNPIRFMCAIKFPWLDKSSNKLEFGLNCKGCLKVQHDVKTHGKRDWRILYTLDGYFAHINECEAAQARLKRL